MLNFLDAPGARLSWVEFGGGGALGQLGGRDVEFSVGASGGGEG